ncbi:unnamed protein product [Oppiella nova]|uniref:FeS assembly protein IscX n=6 Tax=cellular organisms TaxID=131567 RepID=A0A7R9L9J7_9ACAR|nr:unnamed protein product [Oppiella nova]CAG2157835.1 unnamed protein product [Oppiella nova]
MMCKALDGNIPYNNSKKHYTSSRIKLSKGRPDMGLRWTDTIDIAIELSEAHPDVDPQWVRFTDMHAWICALPEFSDDPTKSTEGLLEAIQMAWIDEAN